VQIENKKTLNLLKVLFLLVVPHGPIYGRVVWSHVE